MVRAGEIFSDRVYVTMAMVVEKVLRWGGQGTEKLDSIYLDIEVTKNDGHYGMCWGSLVFHELRELADR